MTLKDIAGETFDLLQRTLREKPAELSALEVGTVSDASDAIAHVRGFTDMNTDELVRFPRDLLGIASSLTVGGLGVILLGDSEGLQVGDEVRRTKRVIDVPVGPGLLGRVVDALGRPLDDRGPIKAVARRPVERPAPPIIERAPVTAPLQTGLKAVDAVIPIGRGQRELILGDRQIGKTAIAVDTMINQRDQDVVCVYCAIGQRAAAVAGVIADLRAHSAMERSIVVVAGGEDAPGLQFVAPYAATTMAEFFMEQGDDALIVYDDLTRHARTYRELALLLRRPPGREAYPGDIFYVHSRLLERSTHLNDARRGGSLTALPIVETQAQNISAYIPTNLISITDGQIYLSPELFHRGHLPAIDIGKSVSRVGGKAQLPAFRAVAANLRLSYSQFEELEAFSRFGTRLDEQTRQNLERGRRVREVLKQPEHRPLPVAEQVAVLFAATQGVFDGVEPRRVAGAEAAVARALRQTLPDLCARIESGAELSGDDRGVLLEMAWAALDQAALEQG